MMRMPALRVRHRQQAKILRQLSITLRPNDQMPVIGHEAVAQQPHRHPPRHVREDFLEGEIIAGFFEDDAASDGAVENMIRVPAGGNSRSPRHGEYNPVYAMSRQEKTPDPFFFPPLFFPQPLFFSI